MLINHCHVWWEISFIVIIGNVNDNNWIMLFVIFCFSSLFMEFWDLFAVILNDASTNKFLTLSSLCCFCFGYDPFYLEVNYFNQVKFCIGKGLVASIRSYCTILPFDQQFIAVICYVLVRLPKIFHFRFLLTATYLLL